MSFLKKWGLVEDTVSEVKEPVVTENVPEAAPSVDAVIVSTENIVANIFEQNGMAGVTNSIYTVRAYTEKLPSEMTTVKKQQTVAGILEVSGVLVSTLLNDANKRSEVLGAARDQVIAEREAEIAVANTDIEALKSAIEVAQGKIKHAEDVMAATKNAVQEELDEIADLVKFCEGMVKQ